jgi:MFS family permease
MKHITRTIWILAMVSLFTDAASEMLYPVMPVYLREIGFSVFMIGMLEGIAEAVVGLSKVYFGAMSDRFNKRLPFVQLGYALSALSKPFIVFIAQPMWVFSMRTLDRLGKGIRTAPRDAILAEESAKEHRSTVFGFHRSMDTLGAVLGPLIALIYLYFYPGNYEVLFLLALIPGVLAIIFSLALREKKRFEKTKGKSRTFFSFVRYWRKSTPEFKSTLTGLILFALFNSSDMFLLLRAREAGMSDAFVVGVYIFYNLIYALFSYPLGLLADRWGQKKVYLFGLLVFATTYIGLAYVEQSNMIWFFFGLYGLYAAATEGIGRSWISVSSGGKDIGTALGTYASFQSLTALLAAGITGYLWTTKGFGAALVFSGAGAIVAALYVVFFIPEIKKRKR